MARYKGPKVYAVRVGRKTGIFDTWEECQEQTSGFLGSKYKSFPTHEEALHWINEGQQGGRDLPAIKTEDGTHTQSIHISLLSDDDSAYDDVEAEDSMLSVGTDFTQYSIVSSSAPACLKAGSRDSPISIKDEEDDGSADAEPSLYSIPRVPQQGELKPKPPGMLGQGTLGSFVGHVPSSMPTSTAGSRPMTFSQIVKQQQQQQQQRLKQESSTPREKPEPEAMAPPPPPPPPPPASQSQSQSQSYFEQFPGFVPNARARFDDEFTRLASSQGLVPGSQAFRRERTHAIKSEFLVHYSQQPAPAPTPTPLKTEDDEQPDPTRAQLTPEQCLEIYQSMCAEVGLPQHDTAEECVRELRTVLVNIVDYIDAKRTGGKVEVWDPGDFAGFSRYTMRPEKRIDLGVAKADEFLEKLLRRVRHGAAGAGAWEGSRRRRKRGRPSGEGETSGGLGDSRPVKRERVF